MSILFSAIGLFLIFEGILPLAAPKLWRKMISQIAKQSDKALQISGCCCLLFGVVIIFFYTHLMIGKKDGKKYCCFR